MTNDLTDYFRIKSYCPARGEHELVVMQWPVVICKHCHSEFMLLTREMADSFFEVKFYEERLNS